MANKITDMSKIRKAIKFHLSGKSKLFISNYLSLSRNTVKKYISLFDSLAMNAQDMHQSQPSFILNHSDFIIFFTSIRSERLKFWRL